jgi:hypothetical protein
MPLSESTGGSTEATRAAQEPVVPAVVATAAVHLEEMAIMAVRGKSKSSHYY